MKLMLKIDFNRVNQSTLEEITNLKDVIDIFAIQIKSVNEVEAIEKSFPNDLQEQMKFFISYSEDIVNTKKNLLVELDLSDNFLEKISLGKSLMSNGFECVYRCTTISQAIIASKSGAQYVILKMLPTLSYSELDDLCEIYKNYPDLYGEIIVEAQLDDLVKLCKLGIDILSLENLSMTDL